MLFALPLATLLVSLLFTSTHAVISKGVGGSNLFAFTFIEVGYTFVGSASYTHVISQVETFKNPHIIMGMPRDGDQRLRSGTALVARVRNVAVNSRSGLTTFDVMMFQPNDSWCNYTWWTPVVQPMLRMDYLIMEEGHFIISGVFRTILPL